MANLYVKNPNYNPLDPRSQRYVTDPQAQQEAQKKATGINDLFAPFTNLAAGLFTPYTPQNFYTPLAPNTTVTPPTSTTAAPASFTSAQGTPAPTQTPTQTPVAGSNIQTPAPQPAGGNYTVQAGDTLGAIAARNGTTVAAIAAANGIADPNKIQIGQVLKLSGAPAGGTTPAAGDGSAVAQNIQQTAATKGGALTTDEIAALAKQAGEAGMSSSDFLSILQSNATPTTSQVNEIRSKLGIPNLVDEAFKQPDKTLIQQYKDLYDLSGLNDIKTKIAAIDETIAQKRNDLIRATGDLNNNPWISQATRAGRLKNLQELAYADINNDIESKNAYLDLYDQGIGQIETQLNLAQTDQENAQGLTVDHLNYLINEAERETAGIQQDTITSGLRSIPDFLKGVLSRESTAQARDLAKIAANKAPSGGGSGISIGDVIQAGGASEAILQASAGGKATTDSFRQGYEKTLNTLYQLSDLNKAFDTYKENTGQTGFFSGAEGELTGPILGILRSANPYDTKAQQIKAQLTAIVPNLARGVYGEVGVLTDQDIALYSQTLPNLKSTKEVRDALLAISAKSVYRALENKLLVQAKGGVDVSNFASDLTNMRQTVDNLLTSAGVPIESTVSGGTDFTQDDAAYVKSLNLN